MNQDQPESSVCKECGAPVPANAALGLCPRCVFAGAMASGGAPPMEPPDIESVRAALPQYEVLSLVGTGGMGAVFKGRQPQLDRFVAIKLLAPEWTDDARFAERFQREARALARLGHPSIVTIHDFGQAGGFFYLVMEFVDGVNLRQAMKAGRFTPEEALAIVPPICEALQYAHEQGIVHRDIKPENLLMDRSGRVKIADFGIAKMLGEDSLVGMAESQPAGTPQYMAPEQRDARPTDRRADIYSLGVVLYELLTGELPGSRLQPPSSKVSIDVRLDEIVLRALQEKPEMRFATAADFRTQLQTVATPSATGSTAATTQPPFLKSSTAVLSSPEELATASGQFFFYRGKGHLMLTADRLHFSGERKSLSISLDAIRELSVCFLPYCMNPIGVHAIQIAVEEAGTIRHIVFSPFEGFFGLPATRNARVAEWISAIRTTTEAFTGAKLPPPPLRIPVLPSRMGILVAAIVAPLCAVVGFAVMHWILRGTPSIRPAHLAPLFIVIFTFLSAWGLPFLWARWKEWHGHPETRAASTSPVVWIVAVFFLFTMLLGATLVFILNRPSSPPSVRKLARAVPEAVPAPPSIVTPPRLVIASEGTGGPFEISLSNEGIIEYRGRKVTLQELPFHLLLQGYSPTTQVRVVADRETPVLLMNPVTRALLDLEKGVGKLTSLQGDWLLVEHRHSGQPVEESVFDRLSIRGEYWIETNGPKFKTGRTFRLGSDESHNELDLLIHGGVSAKCLFRLDGERLVVASTRSDMLRRPAGFASSPGSSIEVMTFARPDAMPSPEPPPSIVPLEPQ